MDKRGYNSAVEAGRKPGLCCGRWTAWCSLIRSGLEKVTDCSIQAGMLQETKGPLRSPR